MPEVYPAMSPMAKTGTKRKTPPSPASPTSENENAMAIDAVPELVNSVDGGSLNAASPARSEESLPGQPTDDDYARGVVSCEKCGEEVPFRHPSSGGFTLDLWTTHQLKCNPKPTNPTARDPIIFTPETTAESLTNPPPKKRRSKRTEDERIEYLRSDPFVAKFEAYRVLCASCNKWIRLRPNSTYCSIPWDAHRKSCLSKKANAKLLNQSTTTESQRNGGGSALGLGSLQTDPYVRKIDSGRALCANCDNWIQIAGQGGPAPDGTSANMQGWMSHRESCVKKGDMNDSRHEHFPKGTSHSSLTPTPSSATAASTSVSSATAGGGGGGAGAANANSANQPSHFKDYGPGTHTSVHESRRRNAEQREASLRQDELLMEVEPNRVFCKLCRKWVQLRQDSSFCAYPWLQHKTKCMARHEKRLRKEANSRTYQSGSYHGGDGEHDQLDSGDDEPLSPYPPESEDGVSVGDEHGKVRNRMGYSTHGHGHGHGQTYRDGSLPRASSSKPSSHAHSESSSIHHHSHGGNHSHHHNPHHSHHGHHQQQQQQHRDGHGHRHGESGSRVVSPSSVSMGSVENGPGGGTYRSRNGQGRGEWERAGSSELQQQQHGHGGHGRSRIPPGLADLDSPEGRLSFIHKSISYLFRMTYESSDEMSISSLMNYLNAAMPMDKHEDFDLFEVGKAVKSLNEQRKIVFEEDLIRPV